MGCQIKTLGARQRKMRFVALVSGGKDSIYSIIQAIRNGHELVACIHLGAPVVANDDGDDGTENDQEEEESYMYQTAASEVVKTMVEECLGIELLVHPRKGRSVNTGLVYEKATPNDEVEDLFIALQRAMKRFIFQGVCSGAILSTYQRVRIENVCNRLGLTSLSYLWRFLPQKELLQQILDDGIEAVVVKVACPPGLIPRKHLNKSLRFLSEIGLLEQLHERFQFHVCGEGGEYESLVLDSPLHKKKLVLDDVKIIETVDGVGELRILTCHAENKTKRDVPLLKDLEQNYGRLRDLEEGKSSQDNNEAMVDPLKMIPIKSNVTFLPQVHRGTGGLLHFSEIISPVIISSSLSAPGDEKSEVELAVNEVIHIFSILEKGLQSHGATTKDVIMVHMYLSEISHFETINIHYKSLFGTTLPPSRSLVAVGRGVLPGGRRVLLDCIAQIGSGDYLRSSSLSINELAYEENRHAVAAHHTKTSQLREVLHVQSISRWAPVCVGPYSQVNTLRSGLQFLAGQIGLQPETMSLQTSWTSQLEQCWRNVAAVLDALNGGSLKDILGSLIYVSDIIYQEKGSLTILESISESQFHNNGSIIPGKIDSLSQKSELFGGYEDEGTWEEMKKNCEEDGNESSSNPCPILVLSISEMPKGAKVEVEVITTAVDIATCLGQRDSQYSMEFCHTSVSVSDTTVGWESGHNFGTQINGNEQQLQIDSFARVIGNRCAAVALITASNSADSSNACSIQSDFMFEDMICSAMKVLSKTRAGLSTQNIVHVRLFYNCSKSTDGKYVVGDDGLLLRSSLRAVINSKIMKNQPAISVIPVKGIETLGMPRKCKGKNKGLIMFAMQVLIFDPVHLETEVWIHKDREHPT